MGIARFESSNNEWLNRTTGLLDYRSAYTIMGWVYLVSLPPNGQADSFFRLGNNYPSQDALQYYNPSGTTILYGSSGGSTGGATALTTATWYHLAWVRVSATSAIQYLNAVSDATFSNNVSGLSAPNTFFINAWQSHDSVGDQRIGHVFIYDAALSQAEIASQMDSADPVRTTNLWAWLLPDGATDGTDYSGNGNHFSVSGTLSEEDGPVFEEEPGGDNVFVPQILTVGQGITPQRAGGARVLLI